MHPPRHNGNAYREAGNLILPARDQLRIRRLCGSPKWNAPVVLVFRVFEPLAPS